MMRHFEVVRFKRVTYLTVLDTSRFDLFWGFRRVVKTIWEEEACLTKN